MHNMSKLQVFSHGFFQDILTLMKVLGRETITKTDIQSYLKERLKEIKESQSGMPIEPKPVDFTKMRVSEKYEIFKQKNPDSNMTIEEFIKEIRAGKVPCKGCGKKDKAKKT